MSKLVSDKRTADVKKIPKASFQPEEYLETTPSWLFKSLDNDSEWNICSLKKVDLTHTIYPRLCGFETMKWKDIIGPNHHEISVNDIIPEAQKRLGALKLDDIDSLISLRVSATVRIWGIRKGSIVSLLWYDPNHLICPSLKKHT